MRILVTGGCGFIGSNFVRYLLNKNFEIVVLDSITYAGNENNIKDIENKIDFVKGDISDKNMVEKVVKTTDFIINFAAETHVDRSIESSASFIKTNVKGVVTLLEAARKFDTKKFVHISTDEVYGDIESGSFKETDRLKPRNPYSASKAAGDLLALSYNKTYDMPVTITRSTNNYGYYHHPEKFIPKSIVYALMDKKIPVYGKGENIRDWLFVKDNCKAIFTVLEKGKSGEIYNIAGKQEVTNLELVKLILKMIGKNQDLIEYVKDRPAHDRRYSLNIDKIMNIGWKPETTLEEGIKKIIKWFKDNTWWWKPIVKKGGIDFHQGW